jgi:15-cis-phytoene synthase
VPDVFDHCEQLVREADKDRFLATLFAPQKFRRALYALYAFNVEIGRVRALAREPMPGELRLQWWREAIGAMSAEAAGNPVAAALREVIVRYRLPPAGFIDLIDARAFDLYNEPMTSFAQLDAYASRTSAVIFQSAIHVLLAGETNDELLSLTRNAGLAATVSDILIDFPRHSAQRRLYVPLEAFEKYGASPEDAFARRVTTELRAAIAEIRLRARGNLARIAGLSLRIPPTALPAFLPLAPIRPFLLRMEAQRYDPFRPPVLPQWRRQWRIWRAARTPRLIAG